MAENQNTLSRVGYLPEGFIHAREARDIAEHCKKLSFKIKVAAYAGKIGLHYDEPIDIEVVKMLENLGYTVNKIGSVYNIDWR